MRRKAAAQPQAVRLVSYRAPRQHPQHTEFQPILPSLVARRRSSRLIHRDKDRPRTATPRPAETPPAQVCPDRLTLALPVPPSINHQYATVQGRRVMTARGRAYKAEVGHLVMLTLSTAPHRTEFLARLRASPLSLTITFFFASALRRDVDGGLKIAQDAICDGLGLNDNRVVEIHLYKRQDTDNPRIDVCLSVCAPPA